MKEFKEMLDEHTKDKRYKRNYYRNLILRSVATFIIGVIFAAFLDAHGLPTAFFGIALFLLGVGYAALVFKL